MVLILFDMHYFIFLFLTKSLKTLLYFEAHRALADVQAMRDVFFCTELKYIIPFYKPLLRTAQEQKNKFKAMIQTREKSKTLLKFCSTVSQGMARKVASQGFSFGDLQNLRIRFQEEEQFVRFLRAKGLSLVCCRKLARYFYGQ